MLFVVVVFKRHRNSVFISIPKCLQLLKLGQAEAWSWELSLELSYGSWGLSFYAVVCCLQTCALAGSCIRSEGTATRTSP